MSRPSPLDRAAIQEALEATMIAADGVVGMIAEARDPNTVVLIATAAKEALAHVAAILTRGL